MAAESYSKRPMWQWVVIYLIIAVAVYGVVYYLFIAKKGGYSMTPATPPTQTQQSVPPIDTGSSTALSNNIFMTKTDDTKGDYMTDTKGMTLYTYDKDTNGVSNCYGGCIKAWPIYASDPAATLPTDITIVKRTDNTSQYAYKGMPLYYYATDTKPGDITGDGVGGVWHIIKL